MANTDVWAFIQQDEFLAQFSTKTESKEVADLFKNVMSVSEMMEKLSQGIAQLDKALLQQVLERNEDLMSQLEWIEKLSAVLKEMTMHAQSLVTWIERVRARVSEPYAKLEAHTHMLARLHETCDLLRRAIRLQHLAKRLPPLETISAANVIADIEELSLDVNLTGLEFLESDLKLIKKEKTRVEKEALEMVTKGLQSLNQLQVGTGIDIFKKLGIIEREVQKLMDASLMRIEESVTFALDVSNLVPEIRGGPGRVSGTSIPQNIYNFRSKLWSAWEHVLSSAVYPQCAQMVLVQNVLNNQNSTTYNSSTHNESSEIAAMFWTNVDDYLTKQLDSSAKDSPYMKQAFQGEYPKLLRLHLDLHKQLKGLESEADSSIFPPMGKCVKLFETAYLSRSLKLVLDTVREMFSEGQDGLPVTPPPVEKVDFLVKTFSSELSVSLVDETLSKPVANNIAKAVSLFCQKSEQMVVTGHEATQVIDSPTDGQNLNVAIINIIHYFSDQVKSVISNLALNKIISAPIRSALVECDKLIEQIIKPLIDSITNAINSILLTMHSENFDITKEGGTSLYMRELKDFITRVVQTYLSPIQNHLIITNLCIGVADRSLELFLRNISLLRPISDVGRKKVMADFKNIEEAVSVFCGRLSEVGSTYRILRSVRPLVIGSPAEIASSPVLGQVIPHSLALTMLFAMGPPQLPSPHQSVDWSVRQMSDWLDKHTSERDRLEFLSGAMQKYEQTVLKAKQPQLHPVYPIMKELLEKAFKHINSQIIH